MQLFKDMKGDMGYDEAKTQSQLNAIKELARRFSLTFGLDQIKTRDAVAALHKYVCYLRMLSNTLSQHFTYFTYYIKGNIFYIQIFECIIYC